MSQLHSQFDYNCNQFSPVVGDVHLSITKDEDGVEKTSFKPVDYEKLSKENGQIRDWDLNNLLKAGINPNFPIHTGYGTRMEGINQINKADEYAKQITAEQEENVE